MNPTDHDLHGLSADVIAALKELDVSGKTRGEIASYLLDALPRFGITDVTEEQASVFALELMFRARGRGGKTKS